MLGFDGRARLQAITWRAAATAIGLVLTLAVLTYRGLVGNGWNLVAVLAVAATLGGFAYAAHLRIIDAANEEMA